MSQGAAQSEALNNRHWNTTEKEGPSFNNDRVRGGQLWMMEEAGGENEMLYGRLLCIIDFLPERLNTQA